MRISAGCRFTNRETLSGALAADDIYVGDASLQSDCAAGRYMDENDNPREVSSPVDGMAAIPGMGWVMAVGTDDDQTKAAGHPLLFDLHKSPYRQDW